MSKLSFLFVVAFVFTACYNKKSLTPVKEGNVVEKTAKRQVPENTHLLKKTEQKLTNIQILENRKSFKYHIIAASYNHHKQAKSFKDKLYQKGYPSIVLEKDGRYRVVMQSFNNKKSADRELARLKQLNNKSDFWVLFQ